MPVNLCAIIGGALALAEGWGMISIIGSFLGIMNCSFNLRDSRPDTVCKNLPNLNWGSK